METKIYIEQLKIAVAKLFPCLGVGGVQVVSGVHFWRVYRFLILL